MHRSSQLLGCCFAIALAGCADAVPEQPASESVDQAAETIINGSLDTANQAVVAVFGTGNSACSGTIIEVDVPSGTGVAITAAHCGQPQWVVIGDDYNNPTATFPVLGSTDHPSYNGQIFDFKMVRFGSASAATPFIPAMAPSEDAIAPGTQVLHVGYGKAGSAPGSDNTQRRSILGQVNSVQAVTFDYNQPLGGPCSGDSGGPQLSTSGALRVVGVTSNGDPNCATSGQSGRVSAVYDSFIVPFINNTPIGPVDCDGCAQAATSGQGACMAQVNACLNSGDCSALLDCYEGCSTNSCYAQCNADHPAGVTIYAEIGTCICDSACLSECDGDSLCVGSGSSSSAATGAGSTSSAASGGGGAPPGGTESSGVGGAGTGDDWLANGSDKQDYDGVIVSSGCALSRSPDGGRGWWFAVLGAGLCVVRRRRVC